MRPDVRWPSGGVLATSRLASERRASSRCVLSIDECPQNARYLFVNGRFSARGVDALRAWVEERLEYFKDRPLEWDVVERFRRARLGDFVVLSTLYAYADVPVGSKFDWSFEFDGWRGGDVDVTIEHVVHQYGIPVSQLDHGHKHIVAFRASADPPEPIMTLPVIDDLDAPFDKVHVRVGLCSKLDWPAIAGEADGA